MSKRVIAAVLTLVMLLGMFPTTAFATESPAETVQVIQTPVAAETQEEDTTEPTEETVSDVPLEVTRTQWIQALVAAFSMTVEEDNYPDNYFSDLTGEEDYYRDILVAVEFGVIDLEAGLPFDPEGAATREFAAHTLNYCLGFQLEEAVYSFREAESVTYPDDIQVAVNRGWFELVDGAFIPEQPITETEMTAMLEDAAAVLEGDKISEEYEDSYVFSEEVIELSENTVAQLNSESELVLANPETAISEGDIFAVYLEGFPAVYQAETVVVSGTLYTISVTQLPINDYLLSVDAQGSMEADLADFEVAEGLEAIYILEDGTETTDARAGGFRGISAIILSEEINGYKVHIEVNNMMLNWRSKGTSKDDIDVSGIVTGTIWCNVAIPFGASASDFSDILPLGTMPIGPFGRVSVTANLSIDGSVSMDYGAKFSAGVSYSAQGGWRIPMTFEKTKFSLTVEATLDASISASVGLTGIPLLSATCRATVGLKVNCTMRYRGEDVTPTLCIHTDAWLYARAGAYASVGVSKWGDKWSESWSKEIVIWDRNHNPVRSVTHFEDGTTVDSCTYGDISFGGYNSYYYSSSGSKYANGGVSSVYNAPTYTYTTDDDSNATITGYSGSVSSLSIPSTIDGHPVTAIGESAFSGNKSLYSVTIPAGVLTIGSSAFKNCTALQYVTMPDTVTTIGNNAFENCTSLTTVDIPDTVTSIGERAFQNCTSLTQIDLSDSLTSIANYTFEGCTQLVDVNMPSSITTIGLYAFNKCSALEMITIPDAVAVIGSRAFYNCTSLSTVNYPKSLESVTPYGYGTWGDAQYDGPFSGCTSLTSIVVPDGVIAVPGYVFYNCTALKDVALPGSLTSIGSNAFAGCTSLESIHIPDSVTNITGRAFYNCTSLVSVNYPRSWNNVSSWFYWDFFSRTYWDGPFSGCSSLSNVVVPEGVTTIPAYAFQNCMGLNNVSLPATLTSINYNAFYGCTGLGNIELPVGITSIGSKAFQQSGLIQIVIPDSVTSTGDHILADCPNLQTVTWTSGGTTVPEYAFAGSTALEKVNLPDNVNKFDKGVFRDCDSLVTQELPASLSTMGSETFYDCNVLSAIVIPESVTSIGSNAFYNCDELKEVTISDGVGAIADNAFYDCDALKTIVIPGSVTSIGGSAFYDCDALSSISVSYGVTSIGNSAFYDCDALETVDMANSVTSLGTNVFYHNDVLKNVTLSRNLTAIPTGTFKECAELEEIVIPYFATSIGDNAFNSSPKLTKVVTRDKLASISSTAFSYADRTVFYGTPGSYTETWCGNNGYTFNENTSAATSVTLADNTISIAKGKTYQLNFDIAPADFADAITFRSSNTDVVTVDETGKLTAVAPGSATIRINVGSASASCKVAVTQAVTKLTLNKKTLDLEVPNTYQLTATITPTDATNQILAWTSTNESAATVDENGLITAVGNGTAVITATTTDGSNISASCTVTVTDPYNIPVESIALGKTALSIEALEAVQLAAAVKPDDAANKALIWTSSDESVATVDANGIVTGVKKGTATITVTAADGYGASASCAVTVTNTAHVVNDPADLESSHNYPVNCTDFWLYTAPGAETLFVTFDERTYIEDEFDYLYIYDGNGTLVGQYSGDQLAGITVEVSGDTVKIQLDSDDIGTEWGFKVTEVKAQKQVTTIATGWSGVNQWTLTDDGVLTVYGSGAMKNYGYGGGQPWLNKGVDIIAVVIEEGVTAVGSGAFMNLTTLETVSLPESLTKMGEAAFYGTGLTSVEIPASLWTIQPYTFKNCSALASVKFNEGNLMKISDGAFYGTALTELVLPDCLDILDVYAFKGCSKLETITIGSGLTEIREAVFYGTAIPTITIPEGITKIGPYAFKNCVELETVELPESLTSVGEASFYACTALKGVDFPDKVTTIGNYAFRKCAAMESVSFGSELTTIGECSFYGCTGLTELVIPDKVTTIKPYAFKTCTGLTAVTLGSKVATIGEGAFNTCTGLKTIVFPASLTSIGDYCFSGSYSLWKLTFEGDAPTIGTGAFKGMSAYAYYPADNATWTNSVMQNYGGTITWKVN